MVGPADFGVNPDTMGFSQSGLGFDPASFDPFGGSFGIGGAENANIDASAKAIAHALSQGFPRGRLGQRGTIHGVPSSGSFFDEDFEGQLLEEFGTFLGTSPSASAPSGMSLRPISSGTTAAGIATAQAIMAAVAEAKAKAVNQGGMAIDEFDPQNAIANALNQYAAINPPTSPNAPIEPVSVAPRPHPRQPTNARAYTTPSQFDTWSMGPNSGSLYDTAHNQFDPTSNIGLRDIPDEASPGSFNGVLGDFGVEGFNPSMSRGQVALAAVGLDPNSSHTQAAVDAAFGVDATNSKGVDTSGTSNHAVASHAAGNTMDFSSLGKFGLLMNLVQAFARSDQRHDPTQFEGMPGNLEGLSGGEDPFMSLFGSMNVGPNVFDDIIGSISGLDPTDIDQFRRAIVDPEALKGEFQASQLEELLGLGNPFDTDAELRALLEPAFNEFVGGIDPNASLDQFERVFDLPNLQATTFDTERTRRRDAFGEQVAAAQQPFADFFDLIPNDPQSMNPVFTADDDIIQAILDERQKGPQRQISTAQARGNLNALGAFNANQALKDQRTAGQERLGTISNSILGLNQRDLDELFGTAEQEARSFPLNSSVFDVSPFVSQAETLGAERTAQLEPDIRTALGTEALFDPGAALSTGASAGGLVGGDSALGGSSPLLDAISQRRQGTRTKKRGLGTQGAF